MYPTPVFYKKELAIVKCPRSFLCALFTHRMSERAYSNKKVFELRWFSEMV